MAKIWLRYYNIQNRKELYSFLETLILNDDLHFLNSVIQLQQENQQHF